MNEDVFGFFCPIHFSVFSGFAKEVTPRIHGAKTVIPRDHLKLKECMTSLVSLAAVIWVVTTAKQPGGATWVNFWWVCAAGLSEPYPIIAYSVTNYRLHLIYLCANMCNFRDPNLVIFYLSVYHIFSKKRFTFHLQDKHSGAFANRKYEELSYPKNQKMCSPILSVLVTLLKMRSHDSQSIQ